MDSLRISFELSASDLAHFRDLLRDTKGVAKGLSEGQILTAAAALLDDVQRAHPPEFIADRMQALRGLIELMRDEEFALAKEFRGRVATALAYFADPDDLIPDSVPGLGFLDDAIMVEIVLRELKHEVEAYADFRKARDARRKRKAKDPAAEAEFIETERRRLFDRIRARRRRARAHHGTSSDFF